MGKKIFILTVILMSVSLIGIISVQVYWIKNAIKNKQQQFEHDVTIALSNTSERIKRNELKKYSVVYDKFLKDNKLRSKSEIKNYLFQSIDTLSNSKYTYGATVLEEKFKIPKIPTDFLNNDSIIVKRYSGKEDYFFSQEIISTDDELKTYHEENSFSSFKTYDRENLEQLEYFIQQSQEHTPLNKRIDAKTLNKVLKEELAKRSINQNFKFGVYDDGLATKIKSGYFNIQPNETYSFTLFEDNEGNSKYKLHIKFPKRRENMILGIMNILLLSLLFIGIIIVAFSTSLYQLVRQKKISEIKTDFINNMTHEFKTPIATINLALDAIKSPKIISDEDKVKRYVQMIRDENKRMHGQVENVLRISKLEKNQIEINKSPLDIHDLIEDAIDHVRLLIKDKKGTISTEFSAISFETLGNKLHLTNVIVNILENAIKYSEDAPKIEVNTESTNKFFILKVKDQGIGMSRNAQKYVFDKFYREYKGNIHNVKGHGLGLAYVKEIVDNHQGTVYVESEKNKGSTFTVKLPLI